MADRGRWPKDESAERLWREQSVPVITLAPPRRVRLAAILVPIALLAVLIAASRALWWRQSGTPKPAQDGGQIAGSAVPVPAPAPAHSMLPKTFPANGFAVVNLRRAAVRAASLSLETGQSDTAAHWVVNLRDWASGAWVATIYLDANSVTTLRVPDGDYQVSAASGSVREGDTLLFGDGTKAFRFRGAVHLGAGASAYRLLVLPPDGEAALPVPAFMVRTR